MTAQAARAGERSSTLVSRPPAETVLSAVLVPALAFLLALVWTVTRSGLPILWVDDITRSMYAVQWANDPFVFPEDLVWLPAPMWLDGIAVWIGGNGWEPIFVVNAVCGLVVVASVTALARELELDGALLAGILAALAPVLVTVSASRLSEPKAWAFTLAGVYCWQRHIRTARPTWYAAAFAMVSLAALSRYEYWIVPVVLLGYAVVARARWGTPPATVIVLAALPLAVTIGALVSLNLIRYGVPLYGGYPRDVGLAHLIRVLWGEASPATSVAEAPGGRAPLWTRLRTLGADIGPYVGPHVVLGLLGIVIAVRQRLPSARWLPLATAAVPGLFAFGALVSGGSGGFNPRLAGGSVFPVLPFAGLALATAARAARRIPLSWVAVLTGLLGAGWLFALPTASARLDDLRLTTAIALAERDVAGIAVQNDECGWLVEYAARSVLPRTTQSACFGADVTLHDWARTVFPPGEEVLVISRRGATLGLTPYNALRLASGQHLEFSVVCLPAPSYPVPLRVTGVPRTVSPGQRFTVNVTVRNTLPFTWRVEGPCPVHGAWEWSREPQPGGGTRFSLPYKLGPGDAATWQVEVTAPGQPGRYWFHVSLVQERASWFHARPGFQPPRFEVDVR